MLYEVITRCASASIHQKPALWRVASYSGPGFPRPTKSLIMERDYPGASRAPRPPQRGPPMASPGRGGPAAARYGPECKEPAREARPALEGFLRGGSAARCITSRNNFV